MKAVLIEAFGERPVIASLPDPTPSPDGVVVRVGATGVCRSDWHGWMGHDSDIELPHVPGHELAGTIEAIGKDVRNWSVGDRVTVPFVGGCGACPQCHSGNQQVCDNQFQPGFTHWGSFAEYVALDHADLNLVALSDDMSFATAASLGCRFATSFRAVVDQGKTGAGQWVAVHGCGGVGLSAVMIASALGAQVVAVDIDDVKLDFAREIGASAVINAKTHPDVAAAVIDATGGGAHVSIDALGHPDTSFNSVLCLRKRGKHVQVGLMLGGHESSPMPMNRIIANELEVLGSHGMQAFRYEAMLEMIRCGTLQPDRLVGKEISLADSIDALIGMDQFQGIGTTVVTSF